MKILKKYLSQRFFVLQLPFKNSGVHWDSHFQNGSSLGSARVHSLTFFCTPGTWDVTPGLPSWPATLQAFSLVVSPTQWHQYFYDLIFVNLLIKDLSVGEILSMLYSTNTNICSICVMSVPWPILFVIYLSFNSSMFIVIKCIYAIVFFPTIVFENQTSSNGLINFFWC